VKRVLFVTYGGGHVNMVIPVARELRRRNSAEPLVLGLTTAGPALRAAGLPALGLLEAAGPVDEAILARGRALLEGNHDPAKGVDLDESAAYLGLSYTDLETRLGRDEAARRYAASGRQAFLPLGPLRRVIDRLRPDAVVATSSPRAERAAILAARERGIPSAVLIDLFGLEWDFLSDPGYGDRVLVLGEPVRDRLVAKGRAPGQVIVTGNPAFDVLGGEELRAAAERLRAARGWEGRKVVLWASSTLSTGEDRVLAALADSLPRRPDWQLVYRPHPNQRPASPPARERLWISGRQDELAPLLALADAVVVTISTVGMEAALLRRPLVQVSTAGDPLAPYAEMGLALGAAGPEDVEARVAEALKEGPRAAQSRLPRPGGSACRVADAVESLLGQ
jgi:hypothetical protein